MQSVHWHQEFRKLKAQADGLSVEQVDFQVQLQHRSSWQRSCPDKLTVGCILESPVGVLPFLFPPPNGLAAVLDDNILPSKAQAFRVCVKNQNMDMHRESKPVAYHRQPKAILRPHRHYITRGDVCV